MYTILIFAKKNNCVCTVDGFETRVRDTVCDNIAQTVLPQNLNFPVLKYIKESVTLIYCGEVNISSFRAVWL